MSVALSLASGPLSAQTPQTFVNTLLGYLNQYSGEFLNSGYGQFGVFQTGNLNDDGRGTHTANLTAGVRYAIVGVCDNDCTDLDLSLTGPGGNVIASDYALDDHPTLRFVAPMTGSYNLAVIMATCTRAPCYYGVQLYGAGMQAQPMNQPQPMNMPQPMGNTNMAPNPMGVIAVNQQVTGNLTPGDLRYDGKPMQTWAFTCSAGQSFQMDILSTWDNYAILFDPMGGVATRDDDGGPESLNARITHTCQMTGVYRLGITVYSTSTTPGPYTLQVQGGPQQMMMNQPQPMNQPTAMAMPQTMAAIPAPGAMGQIAANQTLNGRLETGDRMMTDSTWADLWQFQGTAGQMVTIELRSAEFDTYLQLLDANNNRLAEDDDSLGDLDSRIIFRLPSTGTFQVVVNNIGDTRRAGSYTLTLR
jgi:hypothetical protein